MLGNMSFLKSGNGLYPGKMEEEMYEFIEHNKDKGYVLVGMGNISIYLTYSQLEQETDSRTF